MNNPIKNKIINKFNLAGCEYEVVFTDRIKGNAQAMCNTGEQKLYIAKATDNLGILNKERYFLLFLHELTHAILDETGYGELSTNEELICSFSSKLNEVLQSANFIDINTFASKVNKEK
jgi:hypothetical protein